MNNSLSARLDAQADALTALAHEATGTAPLLAQRLCLQAAQLALASVAARNLEAELRLARATARELTAESEADADATARIIAGMHTRQRYARIIAAILPPPACHLRGGSP
jgi:hypothetical protein